MSKVKTVLSCSQVHKSFFEDQLEVKVLRGIELAIAPGEKVAIVGSSGSGKSTLLHLLGTLSEPDQGDISLDGHSIVGLSERERCHLRNHHLGFIFQFHHLLREFTVLENVGMPLLLRGLAPKKIIEQAKALLAQVGLSHRLDYKVTDLSGGERQRAAIARALVTHPACVLADEPTGNLDAKTAAGVYATLLELNVRFGTSFLFATHDLQLAELCDRRLELINGTLNSLP